MKKELSFLVKTNLVAAALLLVFLSSAFADNITIYDKKVSGSIGSIYNMGDAPGEDQEVEPSMAYGQDWDLEAFNLNGNILSMVGGFDFEKGLLYNGEYFYSGDVFLDTTGDVGYGTTGFSKQNGYDYVVRLNRISGGNVLSGTYNVYAISNSGIIEDVDEATNIPESSPWMYIPGTNQISLDSGSLTFSDFTDIQGKHYTVSGIDLSFLPAYTTFTSHFTMTCGNDNLMGSGTTVIPEPSTLLLLGSGLIAAATLGRKLRK